MSRIVAWTRPDASMRRIVGAFALVGAAVFCAVLLAGCSGTKTPTTGGGASPAASAVGTITIGADGSVTGSGYVGRVTSGGGFWALYDRALTPSSQTKLRLLAILLPGEASESQIAALRDAQVTLAGRLTEAAKARGAKREVLIDSIVPVAAK